MSPAFAHVTLEQKDAASGTSYKAVLKVPHGCGDAATTGIKVSIPEGVISVKPQPKPGWTVSTETGPYKQSYEVMHGPAVKEGVTSVSWTGGSLPNANYDEFVFVAYLAPQAAPTTVYFPRSPVLRHRRHRLGARSRAPRRRSRRAPRPA